MYICGDMSVRFMRVRVHIYGKIICAECTYICDGDVSLWRASKPPLPYPPTPRSLPQTSPPPPTVSAAGSRTTLLCWWPTPALVNAHPAPLRPYWAGRGARPPDPPPPTPGRPSGSDGAPGASQPVAKVTQHTCHLRC